MGADGEDRSVTEWIRGRIRGRCDEWEMWRNEGRVSLCCPLERQQKWKASEEEPLTRVVSGRLGRGAEGGVNEGGLHSLSASSSLLLLSPLADIPTPSLPSPSLSPHLTLDSMHDTVGTLRTSCTRP